MGSYFVAGVYREEVQAPPRSDFATGVPAFIGYAESGPELPQPLTAWPQFTALFTSRKDSYLAAAVRGFFENEGRFCYVVKLRPDVTPQAALGEALQQLDLVSAVDLLCLPDATLGPDPVALQQQLVTWCDEGKERFAILDCLPGKQVNEIVGQWQDLHGMNAALYYPWIQVAGPDPAGESTVPPCGHIAGSYSRTDREKGFFQSPANLALEGIHGLEHELTNAEQAALDPFGVVNCIRSFPGRGVRVWGARTINGQVDWRYINVRRLFLTIQRWLGVVMATMAYEPNGPLLWARMRRTINGYLNDLYRRGALVGATAAQAYYVRCDASTTPSSVREAGKVVAEIGLAAVWPSEFIVVRLICGAGELIIGETESSPEKEI